MMCNPNIPQSGSNQSGSPTGSPWQTTNPFRNEFHERLEKSVREISREVAKLREIWLERALRDEGMPEIFLRGVRERKPIHMKCAAIWLRRHGYAWGAQDLNTVQLFKGGEVIRQGFLFDYGLMLHRTYDQDFFTQGQGS